MRLGAAGPSFTLAVAVAAGAAAAPGAEPATSVAITDADHSYALTLGPGWVRAAADAAHADTEPTLGHWRHLRGLVARITRIEGAPAGAWQGEPGFFDGVERGIAAEIDGYRRLRRNTGRLGRVPFMDLWFRRGAARDLVAMRLLFFRRYLLVLSVAGEPGTARPPRRLVRDLLRSFEPYLKDPAQPTEIP